MMAQMRKLHYAQQAGDEYIGCDTETDDDNTGHDNQELQHESYGQMGLALTPLQPQQKQQQQQFQDYSEPTEADALRTPHRSYACR